ncbi:MAG: hypothetical protein IT426_08365 [Pirellulales bacterium]|nr:hypothetical protein [Pirellulales bacterium]
MANKSQICYKRGMKRPRLIVGILAIVHLLLAAFAFYYLNSRIFYFSHIFYWLTSHTGDWLEYLLLALFPSQGGLISIWAALGRRTPLRVALACIGIVVCLRIVNGHHSDIRPAMVYLSIQAASMTILLLLFRLTGLAMATTPLESRSPKPFQFTIMQIMTWTATVAVILSALHYLPSDYARFFASSRQIRFTLAIVVNQGSVAITSIWLVFGTKWRVLRILGVLVAIGTGTWLLYDYYDWRFGMLLSFEAAWTILSLLVVRWAGYRLTWDWRLRRFKEPMKAAG